MSSPPPAYLIALCDRRRPNSIGFLRFLMAAMVLVSHSYALGGDPGSEALLRFTGVETFGDLAVAGFFVLSGFLIAHSYASTGSPLGFFWHRVLRIFPGFWACLVVTAFVFAPLVHFFSHQPHTLKGFLSLSPSPFAYVLGNASLDIHYWRIGDLLHGNPHYDAWDGSLWTLYWEFRCYVGLGLLGTLGLFTRKRRIGLAVVGVLLIALMLKNSLLPTMLPALDWLWGNSQSSYLSVWFCAGAFAYLVAEKVPLRWPLFILATLLFAAAMHNKAAYRSCGPLLFGYILFFLGNKLPLSWWDRRGDFSYGLYIYAYPIQQMLTFFGVHRRVGFLLYIGLSLSIAMVLAVLSYHLVEGPCLRLKNLWKLRKMRRAATANAVDQTAA